MKNIEQQLQGCFEFIPHGAKLKVFPWLDNHTEEIIALYEFQYHRGIPHSQMHRVKMPGICEKIMATRANSNLIGAALLPAWYSDSEQTIPINYENLLLFSIRLNGQYYFDQILALLDSSLWEPDNWDKLGYPDILNQFKIVNG
jgi:hypothetical protein